MLILEDLNLFNLKIYQDEALYRFTSDSVLLTRFAKAKKNDVVADFCSGSGIVGMHFYGLNKDVIKSVTLFEMQKPLFDMSVKSIEYNKLSNFNAVNTRIQDIGVEYNEKFSVILCNPPYMAKDTGKTNEKQEIALCKSEISLSAKELIEKASKCLKFGGRLNMCYRVERLTDVITCMRENKLEPKKIVFVSSKNNPPYLFMIEGVKGGKSGIRVLPQIKNDSDRI